MDAVSTSGIIIIEDTFECRGRRFFLSLMKLMLKKVDRIVAIFDEFVEGLENVFTQLERTKIHFCRSVDFVTQDSLKSDFRFNAAFAAEFLNAPNSMLVVESLSEFCVYFGIDKTVQYLNSIHIKDNSLPMLCLVHADALDVSEFAKLQWFATTWYNIHLCHKTLNVILDSCILKSNGDIKKKSLYLNVTDDFTIKLDKIDFTKFSLPRQMVESDAPNDLSNLTFNVGIRKDEMTAKKNLLLPFVKSQEEKEGGRITYFPDVADDIDEEDPDADLDI